MSKHSDPLAAANITITEGTLFGPQATPVKLPYGGGVPIPHNATDTQRDMARREAPKLTKNRALVWTWLRDAGADGLTAIEAAAKLATLQGRHPTDSRARNTAAPILTSFHQAGLARDSGIRRMGCIAWTLTDAGKAVTL